MIYNIEIIISMGPSKYVNEPIISKLANLAENIITTSTYGKKWKGVKR
jgi:hypothetical protein